MKNPILSKTIQGILIAVLPHFLAKVGLKFDDAAVQVLAGLCINLYGKNLFEVGYKVAQRIINYRIARLGVEPQNYR